MHPQAKVGLAAAWLLGGCLILGGPASGCGSAQNSATKTNWFSVCETSSECGEGASCLCGRCTAECSETEVCAEGDCGSALDAASQCDGAENEVEPGRRLCRAPEADCAELELSHDPELGDAVPPPCDLQGALICESFDNPFPDSYSTWTKEGIVSLQTCDIFDGTGALHYASGDETTQTRIRLPEVLSAGPVSARFFIKVDSGTTLSNSLGLLELWDDSEDEHPSRIILSLEASGQFNVFVGAEGETYRSSGRSFTRDEWNCVELSLELSETLGSVRLSVNEELWLESTGINTRPTQAFDLVVLQSLPQGETASTKVDFLVDEFVVADGPIGCEYRVTQAGQ